VVGVLSNDGSGHALTHPFAVFGYHVTGSTGALFLYGIVVGAIALAGLGLLLASARRTSRRGVEARRGLKRSRRETAAVSKDRDDLLDQRETARAYTASTLANGDAQASGDLPPAGNGHGGGSPGRWQLFRRGTAAPLAQPANGQASADSPPSTSVSAE
jgi:gas vesicle protein